MSRHLQSPLLEHVGRGDYFLTLELQNKSETPRNCDKVDKYKKMYSRSCMR